MKHDYETSFYGYFVLFSLSLFHHHKLYLEKTFLWHQISTLFIFKIIYHWSSSDHCCKKTPMNFLSKLGCHNSNMIYSWTVMWEKLLTMRYLLMIYWNFKLLIKTIIHVWRAKTIAGKVTNVYMNEVFTFLLGKQLKYLNHVWNEWRMNMNVCSSSTIIYFVVAIRIFLVISFSSYWAISLYN